MNEENYKEIVEAQKEMIEIYKKRGKISSFNEGQLRQLEKRVNRFFERIEKNNHDIDLDLELD